jgi:hypothetical protein
MAYLILAGNIPTNKSGVGCRGYHAFRRGKTVRTIWGAVDVRRGRGVHFYWARTTAYKDFRCSSESAAKARLADIIAARERDGYSRLARGARIYRPSYALLGPRRR